MELRRLTLAEYDDALPDGGFGVFHLPDALSVLADHAQGELRLYGGFKGDRAVALLPTFVRALRVGRAVTSPPPALAVPRLGPLVVPASPKRRKRETVNRRFVDAVLAELAESPSTCRIRCPLSYADPRPFGWRGLDLRPAFTYVVPAEESPATVREGFGERLERELGALAEQDVHVEVGGVAAARTVYEDLSAGSGGRADFPWPYVRDLVTALDDRAPVYVARDPAGAYLGGAIVLYSNDAACYWLGGSPGTYEGASVDGLVHWAVLRDLFEDPPVDSIDRYVVDATAGAPGREEPALGGELAQYYVVEAGGRHVDLARRAYSYVRS